MHAMRFVSAAAALALLAFGILPAAAMPAADELPTQHGGDLTIQPMHHASLLLSWNGHSVLVDPAPLGNSTAVGPEFTSLAKPDIILITHIHADHFSPPVLAAVSDEHTVILAPRNVYEKLPADLQKHARVLTNGAHTVLDGIPIEAVPMYNTTAERLSFHPKGAGNGYILTFGGERVYVAGDTEESAELSHLRNIDVAFIPMNLPFTQTPEAAARWVRDFRPRIVYPYHYRNRDGSKSDIQWFKTLVGKASEVRLRNWYQ
ncbi:MAG TPA: MBL fold metallo-hydrolase [Steroidobacteraceae bacterium]|jgi:L-ascorbate metabolism protein UlaG (beta-lactamase superfamily)|nr:MBL fold metallo-hydrolase [Steroidobacteraceae bacterium]